MRVRIVFNLLNKGALVPFHHQNLLNQLINEIVAETAPQFVEYPFCSFSGLKGQSKVTPNGLSYFSNRITLVISSPNKTFIDSLLQGLFKMKEVAVGQLVITPESVALEDEPDFGEAVKYVAISPIVLTSRKGFMVDPKRFISPETDLFSDLLYESTLSRMERTGSYTTQQINSYYRFQVVPDNAYLQKLKQEDKKFARIYNLADEAQERTEIRGYTLPFTLYAAPEVHRFIFSCGLGEFCNKGFGMVDQVDVQFQNRIKDYHFENHLRIETAFVQRERVA